jgi:hypothetical protein
MDSRSEEAESRLEAVIAGARGIEPPEAPVAGRAGALPRGRGRINRWRWLRLGGLPLAAIPRWRRTPPLRE